MEEEDNNKTIPHYLSFLRKHSLIFYSLIANLFSLFLSSDTVTGEAEELTWSLFLH